MRTRLSHVTMVRPQLRMSGIEGDQDREKGGGDEEHTHTVGAAGEERKHQGSGGISDGHGWFQNHPAQVVGEIDETELAVLEKALEQFGGREHVEVTEVEDRAEAKGVEGQSQCADDDRRRCNPSAARASCGSAAPATGARPRSAGLPIIETRLVTAIASPHPPTNHRFPIAAARTPARAVVATT